MSWKLIPLFMGDSVQLRRIAIFQEDPDSPEAMTSVPAPMIAFLLEETETGEKILVDGGAMDMPKENENYRVKATNVPDLRDALQKMGTKPEEIKTVIVTHLHWDHVGGFIDYREGKFVPKFPWMELYVQRVEAETAQTAFGYFSPYDELYPQQDLPFFRVLEPQFRLLDGEQEFRKGIKLFLLPGHTAGTQGLLVSGETTTYFLPSDIMEINECLEKNLPTGGLWNQEAAFQSVKKIQRLLSEERALFLAPHDYSTFNKCGLPR